MFGLFRRKNPYEQPARDLYAAAFQRAREAVFYSEFQVPDTLDGRFDMLLVHLFLITNRAAAEGLQGRQLSQALFDVTFADMDQGLRENGIGDMGLPKHMRRMMLAFNGRMHVYSAAVEKDHLVEALERNLYGSIENIDRAILAGMRGYMLDNMEFLKAQKSSKLLEGQVSFAPLEQARQYGT